MCESILTELFEHKEKIQHYTQLDAKQLNQLYYILLKQFHLFKEDLIIKANWDYAYDLCLNIDLADTPQVALTLELKGLLWTSDKKLKRGLQSKGFNSFFNP